MDETYVAVQNFLQRFLKKLGTPPSTRQNAIQLALPNPPFHQIKPIYLTMQRILVTSEFLYHCIF